MIERERKVRDSAVVSPTSGLFWIPSQSPAQEWSACALSSVVDPDPNPDPCVLGHPGSGSFYHQAKIVRKTLILTACALWHLFDFLIFEK